ncbi:MAG: arsenate reductase (glutaredoxin) [Candidatus Marinimicrobia bacterium]|nr:arsenate reductase (glutaredoxin) [Candidatus Neomarinimicrobiota bacterium]
MQILEENNIDFEIIQYIKTPLKIDELKDLSQKLNLKPKEFIRMGDVKKLDLIIDFLNDENIFQNMVDFPKIIERPIIVKDNIAVIGRPPENILKLIN